MEAQLKFSLKIQMLPSSLAFDTNIPTHYKNMKWQESVLINLKLMLQALCETKL